ncbi:MAG: MFS transporter [Planctomycetota bacterium]
MGRSRSPAFVLFLTLFLDLVGFSIIFPLFPALLDHYLAGEGPESTIGRLAHQLRELVATDDLADWRVQVLFGGVLGSLYSLLQFLLSPVWGRLSDRFGRRPVLLTTVGGMVLSYVLWFFAGSFALLVWARLLGGAMSGNISTATAAMADVTTRENRAKGMGLIGAAFGLGFILGPALGGMLSLIDLAAEVPALARWGVNPFSAAAGGALLLSLLNWIWIWRHFGETLPPERRGKAADARPIDPRVLWGGALAPAVRRTNLAYFIFLLAFGGMEFTLTFLVRDRLQWTPTAMAAMFVYVGLLIALVQGGLVRRLAPRLGEKRLAVIGLSVVIPGLAILAFADRAWVLYAGLTPMAIGSGFAIPSLTALVSLYSPAERQGAALGVFRSLGALSRAIGPLAASIAYWQFGPSVPYLVGAGLLALPIVIASRLPPPTHGTAPSH